MNKINIKGNNAKVTLGDKSPIIENEILSEKEEASNNSFIKDWLLKSIFVGFIFSIFCYIITFSIKFSILIWLVFSIIFYWLNPKRRFFKAAVLALSSAISLMSVVSLKFIIPKNEYFSFELEIGGTSSYIISVCLLISAMYLFYLDSKEK